jgi:hypothetical protein
MDVLFPAEDDPRFPAGYPATPAPRLTDPDRARGWLDANRASLVAAAGYAVAERPAHVSLLASVMFRYLNDGGHCAEAVTLHRHAYRAARQAGNRPARASALAVLGLIDCHLGCYQKALGRLQHALTLSREAGDRTTEARSLGGLGIGRALTCTKLWPCTARRAIGPARPTRSPSSAASFVT